MKLLTKYILIIFCSLFFWTEANAQNKLLDSLKSELTIQVKKDSSRVLLLNSIANKSYGVDQSQMKEFAEKGKLLANEIGFVIGEARSFYLIGVYYLSTGDLDNAEMVIAKSLELYSRGNNIVGVSSCYSLMGTLSRFKGKYDQSVIYYKKALKIAVDKGDKYNVAGFISNIGGVYFKMGEFDKAIASHKEAMAIYDSLNNKKKALVPLSNIALIYTKQGRNLEALEYFQKCLTGYRENGDKVFGANTLLNIGFVYTSIDENDKALPYIQESLEISKELGNEPSISKCYISLGVIYSSNNEKDKALDYFNKALTISEEINSKDVKYSCYSNIGSIHYQRSELSLALINFEKGLEISQELGGKIEIAQSYLALGNVYYKLKDYDKAFNHAEKGIKIADELSILRSQKEGNLLLSQLYEKRNNPLEALKRHKLYKAQSDSLLNSENIRRITQVEYDYKYKQQLAEAGARESKLTNTVNSTSLELEKSQRNLLLGVIAFLLMSLILGAIIFHQKLRNAKSITKNIAIEQKLLRSQMNPHFIFNALSVLQGIILNKEEEKAVTYLSKFSKLLRIILENSREKVVSLDQELIAVESYLSLQNIEETELFNCTVSVDENIDTSYFNIPPMLIQPFIENAIEHAFISEKQEKIIDIHLSYVNEKLVCKIVDNGIGIEAQKQNRQKSKKSLATAITSERLSLLSKDFESRGSIMIEDRKIYNEQGTIVILEIPYKTNIAV